MFSFASGPSTGGGFSFGASAAAPTATPSSFTFGGGSTGSGFGAFGMQSSAAAPSSGFGAPSAAVATPSFGFGASTGMHAHDAVHAQYVLFSSWAARHLGRKLCGPHHLSSGSPYLFRHEIQLLFEEADVFTWECIHAYLPQLAPSLASNIRSGKYSNSGRIISFHAFKSKPGKLLCLSDTHCVQMDVMFLSPHQRLHPHWVT
jgi:hypothetical protein